MMKLRSSGQASSAHSVSLAGFESLTLSTVPCSVQDFGAAEFIKKSKDKAQASRWSAAVCPQVFLHLKKKKKEHHLCGTGLPEKTFLPSVAAFPSSILSRREFNFLPALVSQRQPLAGSSSTTTRACPPCSLSIISPWFGHSESLSPGNTRTCGREASLGVSEWTVCIP